MSSPIPVVLLCCLPMLCGWLSFILLWCGTHSEAPLSPDHSGNSQVSQSPLPEACRQWAYDSESGSDSDPDRPDPDLVLDDLASRRFHSPTPTTPTNFAVPLSPLALGSVSRVRCGSWSKVNMAASVPSAQSVTVLRSENMKRQCGLFFCGACLDESKPECFSYPRFAWFTVTVSDTFWLWALSLTNFQFVSWSCLRFLLQQGLI